MAPSDRPMFTNDPGIARDVAEIYEAYHAPKLLPVESKLHELEGQVLLVPKGMEVQSVKRFLDEVRTEPERRKGTAMHRELTSFIEHFNRFADDDSAIFASPDPRQPRLLAVLDYHRKTSDGAPQFGEHRSIYEPPLSEEWKAWTSTNGNVMSQSDFAQFLEDRISDVIQPGVVNEDHALAEFANLVGGTFASPSKLIELSRGLAVNVEERVKQAVNLSSGAISVQYEAVHGDGRGNPLEIANLFLIAIPVFRSGALYRIPVRLRYRVSQGRLSWFYQLCRADKTFDHAFEEISKKAAEETSASVFVGTPESQ
jgi:uncharacterized protein YfdQ (DUF2303 family)